jgi:hypothetical protein
MSANTKVVADDMDGDLPSLEEARARLAAHRDRPLPPWLTPEGIAAMKAAIESGIPEISGPLNSDDLPPDED